MSDRVRDAAERTGPSRSQFEAMLLLVAVVVAFAAVAAAIGAEDPGEPPAERSIVGEVGIAEDESVDGEVAVTIVVVSGPATYDEVNDAMVGDPEVQTESVRLDADHRNESYSIRWEGSTDEYTVAAVVETPDWLVKSSATRTVEFERDEREERVDFELYEYESDVRILPPTKENQRLGTPIPTAHTPTYTPTYTPLPSTETPDAEKPHDDDGLVGFPIAVEFPIAVLVVLAGVLAVLFVRAGRDAVPEEIEAADDPTEDDSTEDPEVETLGRIAGETADRLDEQADLANEVYRAWHRMTRELSVENADARTPGEFEDRAIEAGMNPDDVRELTRLFSEVRYGGLDPGEHEQRAVDALRRIERTYADERKDP